MKNLIDNGDVVGHAESGSAFLDSKSIEHKQAFLEVEQSLVNFVSVANDLFLVGARVVYFDKFNSKEDGLSKLVKIHIEKYSHVNFSTEEVDQLIDKVICLSTLDISKLRLSSHILTQCCQHGHCDN